mmetsp:Transcript_54298/g.65490  ORF Transcript_54298/g.65490 Transcript_54298/m.65490 type:complete len:933 (-) Transcript_54298:226-3024(-)
MWDESAARVDDGDDNSWRGREEDGGEKVFKETRRAAGRSVRLLGNVVRGLGESIILAGGATETLTSSTASVAETSMRVVEDFANSLSAVFSMKESSSSSFSSQQKSGGRSGGQSGKSRKRLFNGENYGGINAKKPYGVDYVSTEESSASYISFGSKPKQETFGRQRQQKHEPSSSDPTSPTNENINLVMTYMKTIRSQAVQYFQILFSDVEGVPSMAPEFLVVLFVCYISTVLSLSSASSRRSSKYKSTKKRARQAGSRRGDHKRRYHRRDFRAATDDKYENLVLTSLMLDEKGRVVNTSFSDDSSTANGSAYNSCVSRNKSDFTVDGLERAVVVPKKKSVTKRVMFLPCVILKLLLWPVVMFCRIVFSRSMILFVTYFAAFVFLCKTSHLRSRTVQRNAEVTGLRSAFASIGLTQDSSITESAAWLNALLHQIWRVHYDDDDDDATVEDAPHYHRHIFSKKKQKRQRLVYPPFISKIINDQIKKRRKCKCSTVPNENCACSPALPYGGLEPYLSSKIGSLLVDALQSTPEQSRPSDVAYVSLDSFTLGSMPPIIRGVALQGFHEGEEGPGGEIRTSVDLDLDLDVLFNDFLLILEVKLSSLDYALLPSTKLSIHAVDVRLSVELSVTFIPESPFISFLNVSIAEMPKVNVRITPLSHSSGLRGVDLASLPLMNRWVQDAINLALEPYISPRYVSIDVSSFLYGTGKNRKNTVCPDTQPFKPKIEICIPNKTLERMVLPLPENHRHSDPKIDKTSLLDKGQTTTPDNINIQKPRTGIPHVLTNAARAATSTFSTVTINDINPKSRKHANFIDKKPIITDAVGGSKPKDSINRSSKRKNKAKLTPSEGCLSRLIQKLPIKNKQDAIINNNDIDHHEGTAHQIRRDDDEKNRPTGKFRNLVKAIMKNAGPVVVAIAVSSLQNNMFLDWLQFGIQ